MVAKYLNFNDKINNKKLTVKINFYFQEFEYFKELF